MYAVNMTRARGNDEHDEHDERENERWIESRALSGHSQDDNRKDHRMRSREVRSIV